MLSTLQTESQTAGRLTVNHSAANLLTLRDLRRISIISHLDRSGPFEPTHKDMTSFCFLDSRQETSLSSEEVLVASAFRAMQSQPSPVEYAGEQWDFWRLDAGGRVCLFRRAEGGIVGLMTDLIDPERNGPFLIQTRDADRLSVRARRADIDWFRDSQVPEWLGIGRDHLGLKWTHSFDEGGFALAKDDSHLLNLLRSVPADRVSAVARGHLCFIYDGSYDEWHVLRDREVIARNISLSSALATENEAGFSSFLDSLRRVASCAVGRHR